jgi:putative membrane protein
MDPLRRKTMRFFKTAALCGLVCLPLMMTARADDDRKLVERKPAGEPTTDQEFLVRAIACEVANVKFAEKAAKNASNEAVRKMADTIAEEHKKIRDNLLEQAKKMKLGVVEGLDKEHREQYDRMSKLEGKEFDREYVRCLVEGHEKSAKMYKKWSKDAKDAGLREAAEGAMTKVSDHLDHAKKLLAKVKE